MNTEIKQKYVPCEINVVEFKVERGFAEGSTEMPMSTSFMGTTSTAINSWKLNKSGNDYLNEQYHSMSGITWNEVQ